VNWSAQFHANAVRSDARHWHGSVEVGSGDRHGQQARFNESLDLTLESGRVLALRGIEREHFEVLLTQTQKGVAGTEPVMHTTEDGRGPQPLRDPGNTTIEIGGADDKVIDPFRGHVISLSESRQRLPPNRQLWRANANCRSFVLCAA
jgi:hypothetical protein